MNFHRLSTLAAAAAFIALPVVARADQIHKDIPVTAGGELEIDLRTGGAITVVAGDEGTAAITVNRAGRDASEIEVTVEPSAHGARVTARYTHSFNNRSSDLAIEARVPKRFSVSVKTMGGDVRLEGLEGKFEGETMGGALELTDLRGQVDLSTMGGEIHVSRSKLDGKVSTMGGDVRVEDVEGTLKGSSMGGSVTYRNVRRGDGKSGDSKGTPVVMSSMGGDLNVDDAPDGAEVKTMGGNVHVRSAGTFVKAETMGGDVKLDRVDGWIRAGTMGGDITATVTEGIGGARRDVELDSKSGELRLTVPASLAMDIDIELQYTRNSTRRYRVVSDFPLTTTESSAWEGSFGTPRKTIHATGKQGAGTHRIVLRTVNGDIYLTRAAQ
ncbi:MAG: hypothetical protein ABI609_05500 [Acidobacteriota bacterium]